MRIRSILSPVASAVAVVALATPSQAVDNGLYRIHSAQDGKCLKNSEGYIGGELGDCGPNARWRLVNLPNGTVQIREANDENRCLALSPLKIFPPNVFDDRCGNSPDQWVIDGPSDSRLVVLRLGDAPYMGTLTPNGDRAVLAGQGRPEWFLERLG
ncbi:RICIN domain-containing protein [Streptomyces brevispora]|uniref:RICIN domain-containing protein n=1 Tax=Streptomyces brevispora TaxID=887462 RepID=UPI0034117E2D